MKRLRALLVTASIAVVTVFGIAAPANAAIVHLGYKSCTAGGVATHARGDYNVHHFAQAGSKTYQKTFPGNEFMKSSTMYTGAPVIERANISNGGKYLSGSIKCDY